MTGSLTIPDVADQTIGGQRSPRPVAQPQVGPAKLKGEHANAYQVPEDKLPLSNAGAIDQNFGVDRPNRRTAAVTPQYRGLTAHRVVPKQADPSGPVPTDRQHFTNR
jgi:hypothetical protein